jgi:hypothetical protein
MSCAGVTAVPAVLALIAPAATVARDNAIDPGAAVNGMQVVQGISQEADLDLFTPFCDPVVLSTGRRTRSCGRIPSARHIFVGHGIFAPKRRIDAIWKAVRWDMWVDGRHVSLQRFGHTDRWLHSFPPADGP